MTPNSDFQFIYKESGNSMTTAKLQSARLLPHWRPSSKSLCTAMTQVNRLDLGFELWHMHIIPCRYSILLRDGMWNEGVLETVLRSLGPSKLNWTLFPLREALGFRYDILTYTNYIGWTRQSGFQSQISL